MIVGVCVVDLKLYESLSLKDKRRIVKSTLHKIKNKNNVSISEVENQNKWQLATLGLSTVSTDKVHANKVINSILNFLEAQSNFEVIDIQMEFL